MQVMIKQTESIGQFLCAKSADMVDFADSVTFVKLQSTKH